MALSKLRSVQKRSKRFSSLSMKQRSASRLVSNETSDAKDQKATLENLLLAIDFQAAADKYSLTAHDRALSTTTLYFVITQLQSKPPLKYFEQTSTLNSSARVTTLLPLDKYLPDITESKRSVGSTLHLGELLKAAIEVTVIETEVQPALRERLFDEQMEGHWSDIIGVTCKLLGIERDETYSREAVQKRIKIICQELGTHLS